MIRIAILVSGQGRGSNMQAIIDGCRNGRIDGEVALVVGVKEDAPAIDRAASAGVKTLVLNPKARGENYDAALLATLKEHNVDLICLAGYMRVLDQSIVNEYRNRILNIHPALIPMFCGKGMYGHHVHEAAIARGVQFSGCTVHFVDEDYDTGPIVLQSVVPVEQDDTPNTLAARILVEEHKTYVRAVQLFAKGRLSVEGRQVRIKEEL